MAKMNVELDSALSERAKELTGQKSTRAVLDLAQRRLIAGRQKSEMLRGILDLTHLPQEFGAPVRRHPAGDDMGPTIVANSVWARVSQGTRLPVLGFSS